MSQQTSWVGFDLDGTTAVYDSWQGIEHIGPPIPSMVEYIKELLNLGVECRIFTARAAKGMEARKIVADWTEKHIGTRLTVTNEKDFGCIMIIDDRAFHVPLNEGFQYGNADPRIPTSIAVAATCNWHWNPKNPNSPTYDGGIQE